ncbi:MAG: hypothetical protein LQ350_008518 [Teloschistes chrysophthalmus]|nr:MAG: hypothetical protein LQ350_008518 [Niorma chrysophthalma]
MQNPYYDYENSQNLPLPSTSSVWEPGKDERSVRAQYLDRVAKGRLFSSSSRLFSLPVEVLKVLVDNIPEDALASFALVNSDCQQLARSRQFANLCLTYSPCSTEVVNALRVEALRPPVSGTTRLALGTCIRRLNITTLDHWVRHRHDRDLENRPEDPTSEQEQRLIRSSNEYYAYLTSVLNLITNKKVLPHLETLDFEDDIVLRPFFFDALRKSAIKHLRIKQAQVEKEYTINDSVSLGAALWPLQSLSFNMIPQTEDVDDISSLCTSILRACAPTLVYLEWSTDTFVRPLLRSPQRNTCPEFPRLQHLRLRDLTFVNSFLLEAMLSAELISLELCSIEFLDEQDSDFFARLGHMPTLQTLTWHPQGIYESPLLGFLRANPQISRLRFPGPEESDLEFFHDENDDILGLLATFHNLKSLSIVWGGDTPFPYESLKTINKIHTLEQLHLSLMPDTEPYFYLDHPLVRHWLEPMPSLRRLAFSRDAYRYNTNDADHNEYYDNGDGANHPLAWQRMSEFTHKWRMQRLAKGCFEDHGGLEWVFVGQLLVAREGEAVVVGGGERSESGWLLERIFGCEGLAPV